MSLGTATAPESTISRFREDALPVSRIYLKKQNKDADRGWLYVRVCFHSQTAEKSLGIEVTEDCWDQKQETIISDQKLTQSIWNEKVAYTEAICDGLQMAQRATGLTPTLKDAVDVVKGKTCVPETIMDIFDYEIQRMKATKGAGSTKSNIQKHQVCRTHVAGMLQHHYGRKDVVLREMNKRLVQTFMDYLRTEADCAHNTMVKHMQVFKKMFRIALDNRWVDHNPFAGIRLGCKAVKREVLSQEELDIIANKKIKTERVGLVRDYFVFSCYTGLAYIDLVGLKRNNLSDYLGRTWIKIHRQKTDVSASIPLLAPARFILEKYQAGWRDLPAEHLLFPTMSNQKINAYLKEIADICGIEKKMHFHLARHVFATTVTLANNIPIESVSKMLGHTKINMTQVYAKVIDQKINNDMAKLAEQLEKQYEQHEEEQKPGILRILKKAL